MPPEKFLIAIKNIISVLQPGGFLCFRDYGLYDMTMLRFSPSQEVEGGRCFRRGDGTLSTYFEVNQVKAMFESEGFTVESMKYALVQNVNRKTGEVMRRCFVHGVVRRPG